jgi:ubiquitin carboxyl-terminal hydrolase 5/13
VQPDRADAPVPTKLAIGVEGGFQADGPKFEYVKENHISVFNEKGERVLHQPFPSADLPEIVTMVRTAATAATLRSHARTHPHAHTHTQSANAVLATEDVMKVEEFKVWEEERHVSKYAHGLVQVRRALEGRSAGWKGGTRGLSATGGAQLPPTKTISPNPKDWKCEESGLTENLWLNLSTGYIGRRVYVCLHAPSRERWFAI